MVRVFLVCAIFVAGCQKQNDGEVAKLKAELEAAKAKLAQPVVTPMPEAPKAPSATTVEPSADDPELGAHAPKEMTGKWLEALLAQADANKGITYAHLKKNADRYTGKAYAFTGLIREIEEGKIPDTNIPVTVGRVVFAHTYQEDPVYFVAPFTTEFVEGNVVDMAGFLTGSFTYTSQAGWNITIPAIAARAIAKRGTFAKLRPKKGRRVSDE
jgi:hypothetical protein